MRLPFAGVAKVNMLKDWGGAFCLSDKGKATYGKRGGSTRTAEYVEFI